MGILPPRSFNTFKHLIKPPHSLKYPGDRKGKSELSLKAIQMQEAAVKAFQHLIGLYEESHGLESKWNVNLVEEEKSTLKQLILLMILVNSGTESISIIFVISPVFLQVAAVQVGATHQAQ